MRVERLQNDFQTVYRLPEEAPCPMVQKEEFGIPKKKTVFSCMIMYLLMLQGLRPNTWPAFLGDMEKSLNGQPVLQI